MSNDSTFLRQQGGSNNFSFLEPAGSGAYHGALVAHAGGGQAAATKLFYGTNTFTTVATAADSAVLPKGNAADQVTVINKAAASMNVFPPTGGTINALAANAALAVAAGAVTIFTCTAPGAWVAK